MNIIERLFELQDKEFREFHSKLIPNVSKESVIGVRNPLLKKLAKELYCDSSKEEFMNTLPHKYYEENQLHIMMLCMEKDFEKCIAGLERFLPYADNWAVTDQSSPVSFKKRHKEVLPVVERWMQSSHIYTVRYAINIYMREFLDDDFDVRFPRAISKIRTDEYYLNMMIAWYFATALAKQYDAIIPFIENQALDTWTHNKAIQKAVESNRISEEQKCYLKTLKVLPTKGEVKCHQRLGQARI